MTITSPVPACKAKDPSTCWKHGSVSAESMFQSYQSAELVRTKPASHPVSAASVYSGTSPEAEPEWWKQYKADAEADEALPTTPELVDIIESPEGLLAVVWHSESQDDGDRNVTFDSGIVISAIQYHSMKTGETLGHVKIASMDETSFERSFGKDEFTPFRWQARYGEAISALIMKVKVGLTGTVT